MALIKDKKTSFGIVCNYWRIGYLSLDKVNMYGSITVNLFYDKYAKDYIDSMTTVIDTPEKFTEFFAAISLQENYKNIYNSAYEFVKKYNPFFADAESDEDEYEIDLINPKDPTGDTKEPTGSVEEISAPIGDTKEIGDE